MNSMAQQAGPKGSGQSDLPGAHPTIVSTFQLWNLPREQASYIRDVLVSPFWSLVWSGQLAHFQQLRSLLRRVAYVRLMAPRANEGRSLGIDSASHADKCASSVIDSASYSDQGA